MNLGVLPFNNQGVHVGSNGNLVIGASIDNPFCKLSIVIGKNNQSTAYADNNIMLGNGILIQSNSQYLNNNNVVIGQNNWIGRNTLGSQSNSGGNVLIGNGATIGSLNTNNGFVGNNVVIGQGANSTGLGTTILGAGATGGGVAIGSGANCGSSASNVAINSNSCSGSGYCISIGNSGTNTNPSSITFNLAVSRAAGDFHQGSITNPSSQWGVFSFGNTTADATQTELFAYPSVSGRMSLPNNIMMSFYGYLVARNTSNNDTATWRVEGVVKRTANAASTTIVGTPTSTQIAVDSGASTWTYVMDTDTTNGTLRFRVTGAAATNIRWYIALHTTEIT